MKKILLLLVTVFVFTIVKSQTLSQLFNSKKEGYKISGEVIGLQDSTVMLAYYFGGKQYATDTATVVNGKFIFKGERVLKGGMYLIIFSENKYFDIIVSEQYFSFSTKLDSLVENMRFKNSKENPPFYEYINFLTQMNKNVTPTDKSI